MLGAALSYSILSSEIRYLFLLAQDANIRGRFTRMEGMYAY